MSVHKNCGGHISCYHDGYFFEVSCDRCGKEVSDDEVVENEQDEDDLREYLEEQQERGV
jgi:elongation factor P hydroxylase